MMEVLEEKKTTLIDLFGQYYFGHLNHHSGAWAQLADRFKSYEDSCQHYQFRNKKIQDSDSFCHSRLSSLQQDLVSHIMDEQQYPVSTFFRHNTLAWLQSVVQSHKWPVHETLVLMGMEAGDDVETKYAFRTHELVSGVKVTLLEEGLNPMGSEDGTTGLISWQGAVGLCLWATSGSHNFHQAKILELGSGAGLFGITLLKTMPRNTIGQVVTKWFPKTLAYARVL